MERPDEVSYSDYQEACRRSSICMGALKLCPPDEAVEHWLPELTRNIAVVFSFVGSNMTARMVPQFGEVTNAMQAAKDAGSRPAPNPVLDAAKARAEYERQQQDKRDAKPSFTPPTESEERL